MTHHTRTILLAGLALACALPSAASAAEYPLLGPSYARTLSASGSAAAACLRTPMTGSGVASAGYAAPLGGVVTAQLYGGSGDWDLAVFGADGRKLGGSQAFGTAEVIQTDVKLGERVLVQACRRSGASRVVRLRTTFAGIPTHGAEGTVSLVEVHVPGRSGVERLESLGLDVTHDIHGNHASVMLYGARDFELLRSIGYPFEVKIADLAEHNRRERAQERAYRARVGANGSPLPSGRTAYRNLENIQADLKKMVADRPDLVRPVSLGLKSFQGRELSVLEISKDVAKPNDGKPYFVLIGMHHAREWPAAEMPLEFALHLVNEYGKDPRATKLLDTTRIILMPVTNADGFTYSRGSVVGQPVPMHLGQYRRKTCGWPFPVAAVPCDAQIGVDPNRNYGAKWGGPGASSIPAYDTYRGPSPFSEPEIQSVRKLVSVYPATTLISVHNIAALVLRPPGLQEEGLAPDEARLKVLGDAMGKSTGYTSQYGWQLYDTTGTTEDWTYSATAGFGYTIELGPSGGDFHGDYETHMVDEWTGSGKYKGRGMREALFLAAEHATNLQDNSLLTGRAPIGRTLRIQKDFKTTTYTVCTLHTDVATDGCTAPGAAQELPEHLEASMVVPASGRFSWIVNPSTRPYPAKAGKTEYYKLTCEDGGNVIETKEIAVARGETLKFDMPCGGTLVPEQAVAKTKAKSKKKKAKKPTCKTKKQKRSKKCRKARKKKRR